MSSIETTDAVGRLMVVMECSSISHVVGVVSGHMEKPSKEHGNGCFDIWEAWVSPIVVETI